MSHLKIAEQESEPSELATANDEGLQLIVEIERLQDYVLDELDSLNERIKTVFRTFGYKEVEDAPVQDEAVS